MRCPPSPSCVHLWQGGTDIQKKLIHESGCYSTPKIRVRFLHAEFSNSVNFTIFRKAMEVLHDDGLAKHIGVANYNCQSLRDLLNYARIKPSVLQVSCFRYCYYIYISINLLLKWKPSFLQRKCFTLTFFCTGWIASVLATDESCSFCSDERDSRHCILTFGTGYYCHLWNVF